MKALFYVFFCSLRYIDFEFLFFTFFGAAIVVHYNRKKDGTEKIKEKIL